MDDDHALATPQRTESSVAPGSFHNAHHIIMNNPTMIETVIKNYGREHTLERLAAHTIVGAEFNSAARDPPPSCHPNTRIAILKRARTWLHRSDPQKKLLWLHGPAGVGKSAIIQTIAELEAEYKSDSAGSTLGATLFFSKPNHRDNPKFVLNTIAYQLAISHPFYYDFIVKELARDPKLVEKAMAEQFKRFIIKPFAQLKVYQGSEHLSILIDGLDECKGEREQGEIVTLIARFIAQYPTVPLLWIIAGRPEPHLQNVFSRTTVETCCWKEGVPIDSNESCGDVERYLREKLEEIKEEYPLSFPPTSQWPTESQFLKLMAVALGLFSFAETVVRFIDDPERGDPVSQLEKVLDVANKSWASAKLSGEPVNPLVALDALYTRILSAIPDDVLPTTLRILGRLSYFYSPSMLFMLNSLGLTQHCAYGALQKLHSVVRVPPPPVTDSTLMSFFHASFEQFLWDRERSGPFSLLELEVVEDHFECELRVLRESTLGSSKPQPSNIVLSLPGPHPEETRRELYISAVFF